MHIGLDTILAAVGIIILLGFLSDLIFTKTSIPDVIWLILIGLLIGPIFHFISGISANTPAAGHTGRDQILSPVFATIVFTILITTVMISL